MEIKLYPSDPIHKVHFNMRYPVGRHQTLSCGTQVCIIALPHVPAPDHKQVNMYRAVGRSENPGGAFEKNGGGGRRRSYPSCIPDSEDPDVLTLVKKPVEGPKTEGSSLFPQFLTPPPKKGVYY